MELAKYFRKLVVAEADNGKIFRGYVIDHLTPEENEHESVIIREEKNGHLVELTATDIVSIEIVK